MFFERYKVDFLSSVEYQEISFGYLDEGIYLVSGIITYAK